MSSGENSWASLGAVHVVHVFFDIWWIVGMHYCDIALVIVVFNLVIVIVALIIECFFIGG